MIYRMQTFQISQFEWRPKERVLFAKREDLFNGDIHKIISNEIAIEGRRWVVTFAAIGIKYRNRYIPRDEVWYKPLDSYRDDLAVGTIKDIMVKVKFHVT